MRVFFSVGEPSGDLHGANLIKDLRERQPDIDCVGFGGPKMASAGCRLEFELVSLAAMGLWYVLLNIRKYFDLLNQADLYFAKHEIDAVILIDNPGFNWWIARRAKKHSIPVFYYGVPQMWAWAPWRVKKLKRLVDHVLCKLPFEQQWFSKRGCEATYIGHPYFDELERQQLDMEFMADYDDEKTKLLLLLPGSRTQEIKRNLNWLIEAAQHVRRNVPDTAVAIACYKSSHGRFAEQACQQAGAPFDVMVNRTPELISMSDMALACSGSVSLELLYHRKPAVVLYRINFGIWLLQMFLMKTKFITLVNLLATDRIERTSLRIYDPDALNAERVPMPEYLSLRNCSKPMASWATSWLTDNEQLQKKQQELSRIADAIAHGGA